MTNYYSNSADYHDAVDRYEAQERSERAIREYYEKAAAAKEEAGFDEEHKEAGCTCYEHAGDNPLCPVHGEAQEFTAADDQERSDLYMIGMGA